MWKHDDSLKHQEVLQGHWVAMGGRSEALADHLFEEAEAIVGLGSGGME